MTKPISALDHPPEEFIREVSPEAIAFYVDEISGLYLPDEFKTEHENTYSVTYWSPESRLLGKFGRFVVRSESSDDAETDFDDVLVMGTSIGLVGVDRYDEMHSLRHYMFRDAAYNVLCEKDVPENVFAIAVDYGSTRIGLNHEGNPNTVTISSRSADYGRANTEGRLATFQLFTELLGIDFEVINADPEPDQYDQIIRDQQ